MKTAMQLIWLPVLLVATTLSTIGAEESHTLLGRAFPDPDYEGLELVPPLVSELKKGETVALRIATEHCGGSNVYLLEVKGPIPVEVVVRGQTGGAEIAGGLPLVGTVRLTRDEAVRLDRVLAFYRSGPPAWNCTTSSLISASWLLASGAKAEFWLDESCSVTETKASLPLWAIVDLAAEKP
jgi:hypothetical protein